MKKRSTGRSVGITLFGAMLLLFTIVINSLPLQAQTPGDTTEAWAKWWFGIFGGVNYNMPSGEGIRGFNQDLNPPTTFTSGSGLGPTFGGVVEFNSGKLLGFTLMLGYDG